MIKEFNIEKNSVVQHELWTLGKSVIIKKDEFWGNAVSDEMVDVGTALTFGVEMIVSAVNVEISTGEEIKYMLELVQVKDGTIVVNDSAIINDSPIEDKQSRLLEESTSEVLAEKEERGKRLHRFTGFMDNVDEPV